MGQRSVTGRSREERDAERRLDEAKREVETHMAHTLDGQWVGDSPDPVRHGLMSIRSGLQLLTNLLNESADIPDTQVPAERFARLSAYDAGFDTLAKAWKAILSDAAALAAAETLAEVDLPRAWEDVWGRNYRVAWAVRAKLAPWLAVPAVQSPDAEPPADQDIPIRELTSAPLSHQRLLLDLRYSAKYPIDRLSKLLAMSFAAAQARVAAFESRVAEALAELALTPDLPEGWIIEPVRARRVEDPGGFILRPQDGHEGDRRGIQILPVGLIRENKAGRPRDSLRAMSLDFGRQRIDLWAFVFLDEPLLRLEPVADQWRQTPPAIGSTPREREMVATRGFATLQEALAALPPSRS
jgi:hypothetical protein